MQISLDSFTYLLNKDDMTANIIKCISLSADILIPRSITYSEQNYVIKRICYPGFGYNNHIKNISFANDSEIQTIEHESFIDSSIEKISIPKTLEYLEYFCFANCNNLKIIEIPVDSQLVSFNGSIFSNTLIENLFIPKKINKINSNILFKTRKLISITISKENKNFKYVDNNKIIIGKDDSNEFTNLVYVRRDACEIIIPSFVKKINSYAISYCKNLKKIEFEPNSELTKIDNDFLVKSALKNIIFPSHINDFDSYNFTDFDSVEFLSSEFKNPFSLYNISFTIFSFPNCKNLRIQTNDFSDGIIFIYPNAEIDDDHYFNDVYCFDDWC